MQKIKQNRTASFAVIGVVYILSTLVGVLIYRAMMSIKSRRVRCCR